jgi:hypothetical protein
VFNVDVGIKEAQKFGRAENAGNRTLYAVVVEDFTYAYRRSGHER